MQALLERFKGTEELVAFNPWPDGDNLLVGFVKEVTDKEVTFDKVDTLGRFDDTSTYKLKHLSSIGYHWDYLRKLEQLWSNEEWQAKTFEPVKAKGKKSIPKLLKQASETGSVVI